MKTWVHDCHSTVSQPAELKNDVSRTNSKITMCWSIASFRHTSGPRGRVHHLKSGTLNTASRILPTGLMVIPFRIHIQSSSSGTSARSNVSLTNEKHAQKIDIKTEKRAQSKQEHVLAVLHNCTNDYMWLSYTVLWGEKWCQLTHTTTEQWWVIPYKVMMLWTKRERKNAHTRLVTNDESSQLNTSHDEGNKVLEKG